MKILFAINEGWPGVATNLKSIANVIRTVDSKIEINFIKLEGNNISIPGIRYLKSEIPDFLFTGGWDIHIRNLIQNVVRPKTKVFLQWCSPIAQTDLGAEITRFVDACKLLSDGMIDYIGIPVKYDHDVLKKINSNFVYSPIVMNCQELENITPDPTYNHSGRLNVDMFCAPCPRKNILAQIIAFSPFREKILLHSNYSPGPMATQYVLAQEFFAKDYCRNHSWMSREKYLGILKSMDFASQVTFSESFNYTAAEHMYYGIPVILSYSTPMAKEVPQLKPLVVEQPDNVEKITEKIKMLMDDKFRTEMGQIASASIKAVNARNEMRLQNSLDVILKGVSE